MTSDSLCKPAYDRADRGSFWLRTGPVVLAFLAGVVACVVREPATMPLLVDNQHYFFLAERAASGVPPHVSHFDPKHMLSVLLTGAAIAVGRLVDVPDLMAARAVSILVAAASVALVWVFALGLTGRVLVAAVAAATMLTFDDFFMMAVMGARPKVFLVFFALLTLVATLRRRPLVLGACAGLAFLCWQPAALLLPAAVASVCLRRRPLQGAAGLVLAFVAVNALYEGYFYATGALGAQLEQAYAYPYHYMRGPWPPRWYGVWLHTTWMLNIKDGLSLPSVVPLTATVALFAVWWRALVRPRATLASLGARPDRVAFVLAGHALLPFLLWNYQGFPDRFVLLPFFAVVAALAYVAVVDWCMARSRVVGVVAAVAVVGVLVADIARGIPTSRSGLTVEHQYRIADQIGEILASGRSVWAIGCTHLLAFNRADNYSRYGFFFRGLSRYVRHTHGHDVTAPPPGRAPPDTIIVARGARRNESAWWVGAGYREVTPQPFYRQGLAVWHRVRQSR